MSEFSIKGQWAKVLDRNVLYNSEIKADKESNNEVNVMTILLIPNVMTIVFIINVLWSSFSLGDKNFYFLVEKSNFILL